ncbi:MAG: FHA domain-containing protein [Anaerolineales bacterium]|nr:FHA domain-containing protein [Anaerolineales bacterium]
MQGGSFRLIVRRGPQPNQVHELTQDIITIGRDATNEVSINDPEVSRHHCRLTRAAGGFTIEDLGSTNGTFINGQRVTGARPLTSGVQIGLGETVVLHYEAASMSAGGPYPGPGPSATMPGPAQQGYGGAPQAPYGQQQQAPYGQQQPYGGGQQQPYGQQAPYGGQQQQAPYGQQPQQGGYGADPYGAPAPPPPPDHVFQQEEYYNPSGGAGRWIFLACGVFIVLCIITSVIAIIVIDQYCLWDNTPILGDVIDALGYKVNEAQCN